LGGDKTSPLRFLFTRQPRRASVTDTHLRLLSAGSPLHRRQYISCAWYRCPLDADFAVAISGIIRLSTASKPTRLHPG